MPGTKRPRRRSEQVRELFVSLSQNELGYTPVPLKSMPLDPRCDGDSRARARERLRARRSSGR